MKEVSINTFNCLHNQIHKTTNVTSTPKRHRCNVKHTHKMEERGEFWAPSQFQRMLGFRFSNNKRPHNSNDNHLLDNIQHPNKVISHYCLLCSTIHHTPLSWRPPFPYLHTSHNPSRRDNPPTQTKTYHILYVVWLWHPTTSLYYPQSHYHVNLTIHTKVNPSGWFRGRSPTYAPLSQFIPCSSINPTTPSPSTRGPWTICMHFTQLRAHQGINPTTYIFPILQIHIFFESIIKWSYYYGPH